MTPPEVYIMVFRLENGKTMPMLSSLGAWREYNRNPDYYADKRVQRWNNYPHRRLGPAVAFTMERYVRAGE
jgi:hypothetical protein